MLTIITRVKRIMHVQCTALRMENNAEKAADLNGRSSHLGTHTLSKRPENLSAMPCVGLKLKHSVFST